MKRFRKKTYNCEQVCRQTHGNEGLRKSLNLFMFFFLEERRITWHTASVYSIDKSQAIVSLYEWMLAFWNCNELQLSNFILQKYSSLRIHLHLAL